MWYAIFIFALNLRIRWVESFLYYVWPFIICLKIHNNNNNNIELNGVIYVACFFGPRLLFKIIIEVLRRKLRSELCVTIFVFRIAPRTSCQYIQNEGERGHPL